MDDQILETMFAAIRERSVNEALKAPDGERAVALARSMCRQHAYDPEAIVYGIGYRDRPVLPEIGVFGSIIIREPLRPQWTAYFDLARVALLHLEGKRE